MKLRTYVPTVLIVIVCAFLLSGYAQTRPVPASTRHEAWEYKVLSYIRWNQGSVLTEDGKNIAANPTSTMPHINELGAQGWEMVTVLQTNDTYFPNGTGAGFDAVYKTYYFKRPK